MAKLRWWRAMSFIAFCADVLRFSKGFDVKCKAQSAQGALFLISVQTCETRSAAAAGFSRFAGAWNCPTASRQRFSRDAGLKRRTPVRRGAATKHQARYGCLQTTGPAASVDEYRYRSSGSPVGWIYPSFQASSRHKNKTTDKATRTVSARAMRRLRSVSEGASSPLRSMKNKAVPRLTIMAKKARATKYSMQGIME